ncbi:hypothetical protein T08_14610 [Trichinella sp. T8]|nr:hypothetical protein T08_14610 [Trichinella sp. T8]
MFENDPSHATTALLGPAGAQSREAYYPQLSSMPLGHGSAYPAENGRAVGGPDDPGARVCSRGHGFRRPTICEDDQENHVSEVRMPDNVQGVPRGPPGARVGDVHGGSDASPSAFHSPAGSTGDNPDRQFPIFPECGV